MKKILKYSLEDLAKVIPSISEKEQLEYIGGSALGTSENPYIRAQFDLMINNGTWAGGFVVGLGYVAAGHSVYGSTGSRPIYDYGSDPYGSTNYNSSGFDIDKATGFLESQANSSSTGQCAKYVRQALEAGGLSTAGRPTAAADYDNFLPKIGFVAIQYTDISYYQPQKGDIVVMPRITGHNYGHIAMYSGNEWISDFKQNDLWGGSAYRNNGQCTVYRWSGQ